MHGIMLKRIGHNVRILERSVSPNRASHAAGVGTGLKGHEFMEMYDITAQPHAYHCPGYQMLDQNSGIKRTPNAPLWVTSWDTVYYRLRALYDGFASSYCPTPPDALPRDGTVSYELGKRVTNVEEDGELLAVAFEDLKEPPRSGVRRAQLVIDASGAYSVCREKLMPNLSYPYTGYVAWRGTVPESAVSERTQHLFETRFNSFLMKDGYILGLVRLAASLDEVSKINMSTDRYAVPGENGEMEKGRRLLNWIWYQLIPEDSPLLRCTMTDSSGHTHHNTLPFGKMDPRVWADQMAHGRTKVTPAFLELVEATDRPFISLVRESYAPKAAFYDGRLLLVGEAVCLHRPNSGMNMNQAAIHCLLLRQVLEGTVTLTQWESTVMDTGQRLRLLSTLMQTGFWGVESRL